MPSFLRSHIRHLVVAGAVAAAAGGGTAAGWVLSSGSSAPTASAATPAPTAPPTAAATHAHTQASHRRHLRGTLTAMHGASWTVTTAKGRPVIFTVGPSTTYGTKKAPASAGTFTVGDEVAVRYTAGKDHSRTATRVTPAPAATAPGRAKAPAQQTSAPA